MNCSYMSILHGMYRYLRRVYIEDQLEHNITMLAS